MRRTLPTRKPAVTLILASAAVLLLAAALVGCSSPSTQTPASTPANTSQPSSATSVPTPSAIETVTPGVTEGPYFKAGSPERSSLIETGTSGTELMVTGRVVDTAGQPLANARLEFWQADENGAYDNTTFRYRGHQFATTDGSYRLVTVVPGLYPGRTRHIHVKVIAQGLPELTTQLFFPDEPGNASDSIYVPELLLRDYKTSGATATGTFDFVIAP